MSEDQAEFIDALYEAIPNETPYGAYKGLAVAAAELMRLARRHDKIQERLCNEPDESGRIARSDERIEARIKELIAAVPLSAAIRGVVLSGDPRGYTVKVLLKNGRYNTWGGAEDGWGVP
jgi:hypothetical protein